MTAAERITKIALLLDDAMSHGEHLGMQNAANLSPSAQIITSERLRSYQRLGKNLQEALRLAIAIRNGGYEKE